MLRIGEVFLLGYQTQVAQPIVLAVSVNMVYLQRLFVIDPVRCYPDDLVSAALLLLAFICKCVDYITTAKTPLQADPFSFVAADAGREDLASLEIYINLSSIECVLY